MKRKRYAMIVFLCVLVVWLLFYIRMSFLIKEPEEVVYRQGDTFKYYGLEITPEDLEIYDYNEFKSRYGKPDENYSDEEHDRYVVVNIHSKNKTGKDINIKAGISTWTMSIDNYSNGQSADLMGLNSVRPYEKDADVDLKLFFRFADGQTYQGNIEKIRKSTICIYMSYYPELRYIKYE